MSYKIIENSFDPSGQPWIPHIDITFLQRAIATGDESIIESLLGYNYDSTKGYILHGCKKSSSGGNTTITAGWILTPLLAAGSGSEEARRYIVPHPVEIFPDPTGLNVVLGFILIGIEPGYAITTFADTSTHNIHYDLRFETLVGLPGSSFVNFDDLIPCDTGRITITSFGTQWANTGNTAQFRKNLFTNKVILNGLAVSTATPPLPAPPPSQTIFTLPVGFRPINQISVIALKIDGNTLVYSPVPLNIYTTGQVFISNSSDVPTDPNIAISFDNIEFNIT